MSLNQRNQLMGGGSGQMNLQAVKGRAEELRRSIQECLDALSSGAAPITHQDVLKKYTVINEQLAMLRDQVQKGVYKHLVIHPVMVDGPGVAMALPIQLSSRLTPEMEQDRAGILASSSSLLPNPRHQDHPDEMVASLGKVQAAIDAHNSAVASISTNNGPLDPKGPKRTEIDKMTRAIADLVAKAKEEDSSANFLQGSEALISKGGERPLGGSMAVHGSLAHTSAPRVGREARGHSNLLLQKKEHEAKRARLGPSSSTSGPSGPSGAKGVGGERPPLDPALVALLTGKGIKQPPQLQPQAQPHPR